MTIVLSACAASPDATASAAPISATPSPSPADAVVVSTSAELIAALSARVPHDIVVNPGLYDAPTPFVNNNGHRIRAAQPGAAILTTGLVIGGAAASRGGLVQGLAFDVADRKKTLAGAAINVWGGAKGVRIWDVSVDGHGAIGSAVMARQPDGLIIQRLSGYGFTDYGVLVDANDGRRVLETPALIEDIAITSVGRPVPRSAGGTAEACLWVGNTATVRRAVLRSCAWMGLWAGGGLHDSVLEDLVIDDTPVGVYIEHFATGSVFQRMLIGPRVHTGVVCEWADPQWDGKPACVDDVIQESTIDSCVLGLNIGSGTERTTVRNVKFIHQSLAAAIDPQGRGNVYLENDFSEVGDGALSVVTGARAARIGEVATSVTCPRRTGVQDGRRR
ncbi:MAG: hypothetical protein ACRDQ2_06740 [Gaiellales bacterium]